MPEKEIKDFHCKNKKCAAVLCQTDGVSLFFKINGYAAQISIERFPFPCPFCKFVSVWIRTKKAVPNTSLQKKNL